MTYIDADDTFSGAYALALLRGGLTDSLYHTCVGAFIEEQFGGQFNLHQNDMVWVFGKLYRRAFLDKYQVRFHKTSRANEDNGYNTIVRLLSSEQEQVNFIADTVYYWHLSPNSITRINNCQYSYDQSFVGYAENMAYAVQEARKHRPFNGAVNEWATRCMCHLYQYYVEAVARAPKFAKQNLAACQRYYDDVYRTMDNSVPKNTFVDMCSLVMQGAADRMVGIMPHLTIGAFMDILRARKADEYYSPEAETKQDTTKT